MRVLLVAMPDAVDSIDLYGKIQNLGIVSIAGSLPEHEVRTLDLVLHRPGVRRALEQAVSSFRPQVVGLSAMSFQFDSLLRAARFIRRLDPSIKVVAGGYHASLMGKEILDGDDSLPLDFLVRGEGEAAFRELVEELEKTVPDFSGVRQLSYREGGRWRHNPDRPLADLATLPLPDRDSRLASGFSYLNIPFDVAETSRGCPHNCKFCSITQMYGHAFRKFPVERVIQDLQNIRKAGARGVFFADDNIAHDVAHFRRVCQAIRDNGLNDLTYITQVSALSMAENPEVVQDMKRANFRIAFVGFESMLPSALKGMKKPTNPHINRTAAALLHQHNIGIIAGFIVGYPDDTGESVKKQFQLIRQIKHDAIYCQFLTPYPKTMLRQEMLNAGLVVNKEDYSKYTGFICNTRTNHLSQQELERIHKTEALKTNLAPSMILGNFFLKNYFWPFFTASFRVIAGAIRDLVLPRSSRQCDL